MPASVALSARSSEEVGLAEVALGRAFDPVRPAAEVDRVEVRLKHDVLVVLGLELVGEQRLLELSRQ